MSPRVLLDHLHALGVELTPEGGHLRYRAPAGTLTPDLRSQLATYKAELLLLLEPMPRCATCGEQITGKGRIVLWGGPHHEDCAPPAPEVASNPTIRCRSCGEVVPWAPGGLCSGCEAAVGLPDAEGPKGPFEVGESR